MGIGVGWNVAVEYNSLGYDSQDTCGDSTSKSRLRFLRGRNSGRVQLVNIEGSKIDTIDDAGKLIP